MVIRAVWSRTAALTEPHPPPPPPPTLLFLGDTREGNVLRGPVSAREHPGQEGHRGGPLGGDGPLHQLRNRGGYCVGIVFFIFYCSFHPFLFFSLCSFFLFPSFVVVFEDVLWGHGEHAGTEFFSSGERLR